jgi:hypothetical protein
MPKRHREVREPVRAEVGRRMAELKGQSRAELERDAERGARSPLGGGTGSRPVKRKERLGYPDERPEMA